MPKFKQGCVINPETGETKDIVVQSVSPNNLKDILIGGSMALIGTIYLASTAFKNGSEKYESAEFQALSDADLIRN